MDAPSQLDQVYGREKSGHSNSSASYNESSIDRRNRKRITTRRPLLFVFYECLRNTRLYAERRAKWLPTFSYLFDDIFRETVSVLCLHNFVVVNLHDRCGLSRPCQEITILLPFESSDWNVQAMAKAESALHGVGLGSTCERLGARARYNW